MKVYAIWDNRKKEFCIPSKAKKFWCKKGSAKIAVMNCVCSTLYLDSYSKVFKDDEVRRWLDSNPRKYDSISFSDQTRFECREYDLDKIDFKVV